MKKNNSERGFLDLLAKFFNEYLPISVNASANTIRSYKCAFRLLFQYLNAKTDIKSSSVTFKELDFDLLTNFFDWLVTERKNSRNTAKQRIGALLSFADYAQNRNLEAGYIFKNSLDKIYKKSFKRVKGKQRCHFTREELAILFKLPDTSDRIGWRDLVVLVVMYSSGARAQEICNLAFNDVNNCEDNILILTLIGKGDKARRVKLTGEASNLLTKYMAYRKKYEKPSTHVFSSQRNEQMSVSCVEEIFSKYITAAKSAYPDKFNSGRYTPHVMRHTTATHLIEAGVPLPIVKNILGHTSIQTTQIYVDISQQTVDRSIKEWNEKWFYKSDGTEGAVSENQDDIPDFLK